MNKRIRGRRLQEIRKLQLRANPLCVVCEREGRVHAATEVDHIVPLFRGGSDTAGNRQSLCADCHRKKTDSDLGRRSRPTVGGDGVPIDPNHHWNARRG